MGDTGVERGKLEEVLLGLITPSLLYAASFFEHSTLCLSFFSPLYKYVYSSKETAIAAATSASGKTFSPTEGSMPFFTQLALLLIAYYCTYTALHW